MFINPAGADELQQGSDNTKINSTGNNQNQSNSNNNAMAQKQRIQQEQQQMQAHWAQQAAAAQAQRRLNNGGFKSRRDLPYVPLGKYQDMKSLKDENDGAFRVAGMLQARFGSQAAHTFRSDRNDMIMHGRDDEDEGGGGREGKGGDGKDKATTRHVIPTTATHGIRGHYGMSLQQLLGGGGPLGTGGNAQDNDNSNAAANLNMNKQGAGHGQQGTSKDAGNLNGDKDSSIPTMTSTGVDLREHDVIGKFDLPENLSDLIDENLAHLSGGPGSESSAITRIEKVATSTSSPRKRRLATGSATLREFLKESQFRLFFMRTHRPMMLFAMDQETQQIANRERDNYLQGRDQNSHHYNLIGQQQQGSSDIRSKQLSPVPEGNNEDRYQSGPSTKAAALRPPYPNNVVQVEKQYGTLTHGVINPNAITSMYYNNSDLLNPKHRNNRVPASDKVKQYIRRQEQTVYGLLSGKNIIGMMQGGSRFGGHGAILGAYGEVLNGLTQNQELTDESNVNNINGLQTTSTITQQDVGVNPDLSSDPTIQSNLTTGGINQSREDTLRAAARTAGEGGKFLIAGLVNNNTNNSGKSGLGSTGGPNQGGNVASMSGTMGTGPVSPSSGNVNYSPKSINTLSLRKEPLKQIDTNAIFVFGQSYDSRERADIQKHLVKRKKREQRKSKEEAELDEEGEGSTSSPDNVSVGKSEKELQQQQGQESGFGKEKGANSATDASTAAPSSPGGREDEDDSAEALQQQQQGKTHKTKHQIEQDRRQYLAKCKATHLHFKNTSQREFEQKKEACPDRNFLHPHRYKTNFYLGGTTCKPKPVPVQLPSVEAFVGSNLQSIGAKKDASVVAGLTAADRAGGLKDKGGANDDIGVKTGYKGKEDWNKRLKRKLETAERDLHREWKENQVRAPARVKDARTGQERFVNLHIDGGQGVFLLETQTGSGGGKSGGPGPQKTTIGTQDVKDVNKENLAISAIDQQDGSGNKVSGQDSINEKDQHANQNQGNLKDGKSDQDHNVNSDDKNNNNTGGPSDQSGSQTQSQQYQKRASSAQNINDAKLNSSSDDKAPSGPSAPSETVSGKRKTNKSNYNRKQRPGTSLKIANTRSGKSPQSAQQSPRSNMGASPSDNMSPTSRGDQSPTSQRSPRDHSPTARSMHSHSPSPTSRQHSPTSPRQRPASAGGHHRDMKSSRKHFADLNRGLTILQAGGLSLTISEKTHKQLQRILDKYGLLSGDVNLLNEEYIKQEESNFNKKSMSFLMVGGGSSSSNGNKGRHALKTIPGTKGLKSNYLQTAYGPGGLGSAVAKSGFGTSGLSRSIFGGQGGSQYGVQGGDGGGNMQSGTDGHGGGEDHGQDNKKGGQTDSSDGNKGGSPSDENLNKDQGKTGGSGSSQLLGSDKFKESQESSSQTKAANVRQQHGLIGTAGINSLVASQKRPALVNWSKTEVAQNVSNMNRALKQSEETKAQLTQGLQEVLYSQEASRLENSLRKGKLLKIRYMLTYDILSRELRKSNEQEYLKRFRRPEAKQQLGLYRELLQIVSQKATSLKATAMLSENEDDKRTGLPASIRYVLGCFQSVLESGFVLDKELMFSILSQIEHSEWEIKPPVLATIITRLFVNGVNGLTSSDLMKFFESEEKMPLSLMKSIRGEALEEDEGDGGGGGPGGTYQQQEGENLIIEIG